jgi:hypothetical protein
MSGVLLGVAGAGLIHLLVARALRTIIDSQSRILAETGRQRIPGAKQATLKGELSAILVLGLIALFAFLAIRLLFPAA